MRVLVLWLGCVSACTFHLPGPSGGSAGPDGPPSPPPPPLDADGGDPDGGGTTSIILAPVADSWLRQQFPTEIHGRDSDLRTGSGSTLARANRMVLKFDVSSLPAACDVTDAGVYAYYFAEDFSGVTPTFEAHRITAQWDEASATWNDRELATPWGVPGGDFDAAIEAATPAPAGAFGFLSWSVTNLVAQWLSGAVPNFGLAIVEPNDNNVTGGRKLFHSEQSNVLPQDLRPFLRITCRAAAR